jgi:AcrR family transcriptional regulator
MSPRKYEMRQRAAAVEETRRKILTATRALHEEQGIVATSWDQIAKRAGVGVGTVYRHFPSLQELVPACGALIWENLAVPMDPAAEFAGLDGAEARLRRLVELEFAVYERGARAIEIGRAENDDPSLPDDLRHGNAAREAAFDALVAEALRPLGQNGQLATFRALTEVGVWRALKDHGIEGEAAVDTVAALLVSLLRRSP